METTATTENPNSTEMGDVTLRDRVVERLRKHRQKLDEQMKVLHLHQQKELDELVNFGVQSSNDSAPFSVPSVTSTNATAVGTTDEDASDHTSSIGARAKQLIHERRSRRDQELARRRTAEEELLRDRPSINANSEKMVAGSRGSKDVGQYLYERALEQMQRREVLQEEMLEKEVPANPAITKQAAVLVRDGAVGDRLYQNAKELEAKRQHMQDTADMQAKLSTLRKRTGASPQQSGEDLPAGSTRYTDELYRKGLQQRRDLENKVRMEAVEAEKRARPNISNKSKKIAAELGPSKDRLLRPKVELKPSTEPDKDCVFKPKINKHSSKLAKEARRSDQQTHDRLHLEYQRMLEKRRHMSSEQFKTEKELEGCTFQPKVAKSRRSLSLHQSDSTMVEDDASMKVEDRMALWERRRQARLKAQQKQKEEQELSQEYTFKPNVDTSVKAARMQRIRKGSSPSKRVVRKSNNSFDKFVERQKRARDERKRVEDIHKLNGSKWTGQLTVPREPKLESERRIRQRKEREQYIRVQEERMRRAKQQEVNHLGGLQNEESSAADIPAASESESIAPRMGAPPPAHPHPRAARGRSPAVNVGQERDGATSVLRNAEATRATPEVSQAKRALEEAKARFDAQVSASNGLQERALDVNIPTWANGAEKPRRKHVGSLSTTMSKENLGVRASASTSIQLDEIERKAKEAFERASSFEQQGEEERENVAVHDDVLDEFPTLKALIGS